MMRTLLITLTTLALLGAPALAAPELNNADALRLQGIFSQILEKQKESYALSGGQLRTDGAVEVEQAGSYYALTLPAMTTIAPNGLRGDIGMTAINATPSDTPGEWKMSVAIPTPITYTTPDGKPALLINIGSQRMNGVWNEALGYFSKTDGTYDNVLIQSPGGQTFSIGKLTVKADVQTSKEKINVGMADLTLKLGMDGFSVTPPKGDYAEIIPSTLHFDITADNLPYKQLSTFGGDTLKSVASTGPASELTGVAFLNFLPQIFAQAGTKLTIRPSTFGNSDYKTALSGVIKPSTSPQAKATGTLRAEISGLPGMISKFQQKAASAPPAQQQKYLSLLTQLTLLGAMGKPANGGSDVKSYDLVLGEEGQVMLNGTDFSTLFAAAPASKAKSPAQR